MIFSAPAPNHHKYNLTILFIYTNFLDLHNQTKQLTIKFKLN